ncbi:MAG: aldehyde dehydrogenase family protein [Candidatus Thorarchaeota archaeon]
MRFFGHLIKGEISAPEDGRINTFPNMNSVISDPRILFAMALRSQGATSRFAARYLTRFLPEKVPEVRLLKDHIRTHGFPRATKDEIDNIQFAQYAIGGVRETAIACEEAQKIRHQMHRDAYERGKGLSLQDRADSLLKMQELLWKHFEAFKEIGLAEGTPVKLFDWQTKGVFNTLYREHIDWASSKIASKEIPSSTDGERTVLSRFPFGSVGIFPPYNAAIGLGGMAIISSYWAGNATVIRTPSKMPLTNMELAYVLRDLMEELEFPISAFQSVIGPARSIANYMVNDAPLNAMVYYGDSKVGLQLMAQAIKRGLHFVPELAGSGASLVWKDVDIDQAAEFVSHARFFGSGQICLAAKRLFVHEAIHDEFIDTLVEKSEKLQIGLPEDSQTDLPIVGARPLYQVMDMTHEALKRGATLHAGGYRVDVDGSRDKAGLFIKPTILSNVPLDCQMWYHETFGPVLPIMKIKTFDEAIKQVNNTPYGLRTSVYTDDPTIWQRFFDEIEAPGVAVNTNHLHFDDYYPHLGGLKTSGVFGGKYFYEVLTYMKYRHFPA